MTFLTHKVSQIYNTTLLYIGLYIFYAVYGVALSFTLYVRVCLILGGKAECDRAAATIKRHIRLYVAEKHDVERATQFFEAAESHNGISGTSFHLGRIMIPDSASKRKSVIEGISTLNSFSFDDDGIRTWKAYDVGDGKCLSKKCIEVHEKDLPVFEEIRKTQRPVTWRVLRAPQRRSKEQMLAGSSDEDLNDDPSSSPSSSEVEEVSRRIFACPEDGCVKTYRYQSHLERHLLTERHRYFEKKLSFADSAKVEYQKALASLHALRVKANNITGTSSQPSERNKDHQLRGWALKISKPSTPFSEEQREFLTSVFLEGEKTNRKYAPEAVAEMMRKAIRNGQPRFEREEWLSREQIAGFFSRLAAKRQLDTAEETEIEALGEDAAAEAFAAEETDTIESIKQQLAANIYSDSDEELAGTACRPKIKASYKPDKDTSSEDEPPTAAKGTRGRRKQRGSVRSTSHPVTRQKGRGKSGEHSTCQKKTHAVIFKLS